MKLSDIIDVVAEDGGNTLTKGGAKTVLSLVLDTIANALRNGDKVELPGIGKLEVKERNARTGRNPKTGESIEIGASKSVGFKVASGLKKSL